MSLLLTNGTVIDAVSDEPLEGLSILIDQGRIQAIGPRDNFGSSDGASVLDVSGKYLIPGLMNANVHLLGDTSLETLSRHDGHFNDLIVESAQVALQNGLTTVFDTWGPRRHLMEVRDQINDGRVTGSRIFCAGNIVGFDGPYSPDFNAQIADIASPSFVRRINAIWVENVGRHLMWLTPDGVAEEVRTYIDRGIDFVKYASNEHGQHSAGAFLQFSSKAQEAIVAEAHRAGLTAQAHCQSVEGLRMAIDAGCDLVTHCNITGPVAIPEATLDLFIARDCGAVIFPWPETGLEWIRNHVPERQWTMLAASDQNARNLIRAGARLMLANDGFILAPERRSDPKMDKSFWGVPEQDSLGVLATGHFVWLRAMEEKGCRPIELLRAATRNIAEAYGKGKELGTLEAGKIADLVVLNENPLDRAANYERIHLVLKEGQVVDRDALPTNPVLVRPAQPPAAEEAAYRLALTAAPGLPVCTCMWH